VSYSASGVKIYKRMSSPVHFEKKSSPLKKRPMYVPIEVVNSKVVGLAQGDNSIITSYSFSAVISYKIIFST
jgi:hypothetical protein